MKLPDIIKKPAQSNPKKVQYFSVLEARNSILEWLFVAFAFDIIGSSILATAQVIVDGNSIKGIAIAVNMP